MCGIYCTVHASRDSDGQVQAPALVLLKRRGPDSYQQHAVDALLYGNQSVTITFISTVLALRGQAVITQPLVDQSSGSVLCWNGEAWSRDSVPISGNDSQVVFDALAHAANGVTRSDSEAARRAVLDALSSFRGPYAFVFYDAIHKLLFYGRDCLGRRSLVQKYTPSKGLVLSSVCDADLNAEWTEVEADGVYFVDLSNSADHPDSTESSNSALFNPQRIAYQPSTACSSVASYLV